MKEEELKQKTDEMVAHIYAAFGTDSGYLFGLQPSEKSIVRIIVRETLEEAERRGWMGPKEAQDGSPT